MKFKIYQLGHTNTYWIYLVNDKNGEVYEFDQKIANIIGISIDKYHSELLQFSTDPPHRQYYDKLKTDVVFHKIEEAEAAKNYLETKYGLILELIS